MGVPRDATEAQIKQAYRKLARKYHPDVSKEKDAEARFKELGEAYEVLKEPGEARRLRSARRGPRPASSSVPRPTGARASSSAAPARRGAGRRSQRFLRSAVRRGTPPGRDRGRARHDPATRRGPPRQGDARSGRRLSGWIAHLHAAVPEIDARGTLIAKERMLNVQMPKGILPGQTIRLAGQGAPRAGKGRAGDLYIEVEFQPHPLYRVDGRDLVSRAAGGAVGSGARRHSQDADARRRRGSEGAGGVAGRHANCG